jgi:superfamily II DNA helicase RecQ
MKGFEADMMEFIRVNYPGESGIIYCLSRKDCEDVANKLTVSFANNFKRVVGSWL